MSNQTSLAALREALAQLYDDAASARRVATIIWGIDARRTPPRDIDAASSLRQIQDPKVFESKLRDWIRDATNPPIMSVEYEAYPGPSGEGFVVCLIPESRHKPPGPLHLCRKL